MNTSRRMSLDEYLELATPWFDKVLAGKNMDYRMLASLMHARTEVFNRRSPTRSAFWRSCRSTTLTSTPTRR